MEKNNQQPILELDSIIKTYAAKQHFFSKSEDNVVALDNVSFKIYPKEIFGLVGQSGSGKTTAGRLVVKLEEPTNGTIKLNGERIDHLKGRKLKAYRKKVQMIFQDPYQSLNPYLSVSETILEPLLVNAIGSCESRKEKVIKTLESVGLSPGEEFYYRYPHQLSGGQRQRVAIARAIVLEPEFIVADEPTSMLDATIAIQLFKIMLTIRQDYQMAFLFITHNLAAAKYLCDRVAVIHNGNIVEIGTTKEVIENPQHDYTKKLIAAQPGFNC